MRRIVKSDEKLIQGRRLTVENKKSTKREILEYAIVIVIGIALALLIRIFVAQIFLVSGQSMEPTLQNRDAGIVYLGSYRKHDPKIGDIVVVKENHINKKIIKRVIGKPGDTIEVKDGVLYRNDKAVEEPYIKEKMKYDYPKITVPADNYFCMGDNRNNSSDSREFGTFSKDQIIGKLVFELWNNPFKTFKNPLS